MPSFRFLSLIALAGGVTLSACDSLQPDTHAGAALHFTNDPTIATRLQPVTAAPVTVAGKTASVQLEVVGKVAPMTINGATAFANGIQLVDGKVFVSYITPGNGFGGGIDLLQNPATPLNIASAKSSQSDVIDVSGVAVSGNVLYVSGSLKEGTPYGDGRQVISKDNGAFLLRTTVSDMETNSAVANLQSGDVNDLMLGSNGYLYATSGATGRVYTLLPATLTTLSSWSANDLRSVLPTSNGVYALSAKGLHYRSSTTISSSYSTIATYDAGNFFERGIARMTAADGYLFVPLNKGGMVVVNTATNKEVARTAVPLNGVTVRGNLVFGANYEGGVAVFEWNASKGTLEHVSQVNLGFEVNQIVYANDHLFVATADGGVRIVKVTTG